MMKKEVQAIYTEDKDNDDCLEPSEVTRLVLSECGIYFYLGYKDGLVQAISSVDLSF